MPVFPSVEWFQSVATIINGDEEYHQAGTCDAAVGIQVGDRLFQVDFEAFEITGVQELNPRGTYDLDFTLVLPYERWKEMLENIRANGHADLTHTLNSLDLESAEEFARAEDYYRRDKFYRFNQSFQLFFDASSRIETQFAGPAAVAGER